MSHILSPNYHWKRFTQTTKLISTVLELNETGPEISASIKRSLTSIKVTWDPNTISGIKGEINGFELVYELVKVNGKPSENPVRTRIVLGSNYTEYLLTDLSPFAQYKIKMAALTAEGTGKFSDPVYGGRRIRNNLFNVVT